MRAALFLAALLLLAGRALPAGAQNPHDMLDENGKLDMSACSFCHEESLELSRPKEEVCTFCHATTVHAGSAEHLAATAAEVTRHVPKDADGTPSVPLTDGGRMYCASCHLFHDPAVAGEKWQPSAWVPPATGLSLAVREALATRLASLSEQRGGGATAAKFAERGTKMLRFPVGDGSLCRHCHASLARPPE
jgi:hypothetical protein